MLHRIFDWKYATIHCHVSWLFTTTIYYYSHSSWLFLSQEKNKYNIQWAQLLKKIASWLACRTSQLGKMVVFQKSPPHKPPRSWTSRDCRSNFCFRSSVRNDFAWAFQETGLSITQNRKLQFCLTGLAAPVCLQSVFPQLQVRRRSWRTKKLKRLLKAHANPDMQRNSISISTRSWYIMRLSSIWLLLNLMVLSEYSLYFGMTQRCQPRYSDSQDLPTCLFYHPSSFSPSPRLKVAIFCLHTKSSEESLYERAMAIFLADDASSLGTSRDTGHCFHQDMTDPESKQNRIQLGVHFDKSLPDSPLPTQLIPRHSATSGNTERIGLHSVVWLLKLVPSRLNILNEFSAGTSCRLPVSEQTSGFQTGKIQ